MATHATLKSRIPQIITEIEVKVGVATKLAATQVAAAARQRAPVGTPSRDPHPGRLKASIKVEDRRSTTGRPHTWAVVADARDDRGVPYAHMVEFGSVHNTPHPFMVPAYEEVRLTGKPEIAAALRLV